MVERLRSQVKNMEDSKRSFVKEETSWNWEEYLKEIGWFARICNLPDKGLIPSEISSNLVTPLMLQECFGKRGNSGYKLTNCMIIPQAEIKALLQAVNGHQSSPFNNLLSTTTANGIYADRILNLKVNWAAYAHTKHKNQLQLAWKRGRPAPDAPPLLRHPVRYEPPPPLNVKANQRRGPVEAPLESPFTNAGANPVSDKTRSCSKKSASAKGKSTIPPRSRTGFKLEPDDSNLAGNVSSEGLLHAQKPLLSVLTPDAINLEISRMTRLQKRFQDDLLTLKMLLDLVSKRGRTELTDTDADRQVADEDEHFSTVNSREVIKSGRSRVKKGETGQGNNNNNIDINAAHEEVIDADLGGTSARTHDKYRTWIRKCGTKTGTQRKKGGCGIQLSPSAAQWVGNLFSGGNETSRDKVSPSSATAPHEMENVVQTESAKDENRIRSKKSPINDAASTQNHTRLLRKNKLPPVPEVPQQQFTKLPQKRKPI